MGILLCKKFNSFHIILHNFIINFIAYFLSILPENVYKFELTVEDSNVRFGGVEATLYYDRKAAKDAAFKFYVATSGSSAVGKEGHYDFLLQFNFK